MSMAGHPDYDGYKRLTEKDLQQLSTNELLYSYIIMSADFDFPSGTKYPSIPCYVDESCTIFPLKGSCVLTGAEYILAKSQGCNLHLHDIHYVPFKTIGGEDNKNVSRPFETILKTVQERRREYPKGSLSNLMYKEIGNSIYGSVVRGMNNKKKFDTKTKTTQRMSGDDLSNPLIAS